MEFPRRRVLPLSFFIAVAMLALAFGMLAWLLYSQAPFLLGEQVTFRIGCTDLFDPWSGTTQQQRKAVCDRHLPYVGYLHEHNLLASRCRFLEAQVVRESCPLGQGLSCRYICSR